MQNNLKDISLSTSETVFPQYPPYINDIFFQYKYTEENVIYDTLMGDTLSMAHSIPYKMNFYGITTHTALLTRLSTLPKYRRKGGASHIIQQFHRRLYHQGALLSFIIPENQQLTSFFERPDHGAYWTTVFRCNINLKPKIETSDTIQVKIISAEESIQRPFLTFYKRIADHTDFCFVPEDNDLKAELELHAKEGGKIYVAYNKQKIIGLCLPIEMPDKSIQLRDIIVSTPKAQDKLITTICKDYNVTEIHYKGACPGALTNAEPYAMARVINVVKFFRTILHNYPGLELSIGIDGDTSIPENNGYYMLKSGKVIIVAERPDLIVTPGGLAAMFLGSYPTILRNQLEQLNT